MSASKGFLNEVKAVKVTGLGLCFGLMALLCLPAAPAYALSNRTWVSGVGSDLNPCTRTAPCLTFQLAHDTAAAGGEINCLDSGGFGSVIITKAISILCEGVVGGLLSNLSNGVTVNAGAGDVVVLRGLDITGIGIAGPGITGVRFFAGAALHIENCRIRGFNVPSGWGIEFLPNAAAELYVTDTTVSNNGLASGGGIRVQAPAGSTSKVTINRSDVQNNIFGIKADGTGTGGGAVPSGGVINMTIRDTASVGNSSNGIVGTTVAGGAAIVMMVDRSAASHNAAGFGIIADGPATTIRIGGSSITGNANGVGASNGGTLLSFKTNQIRGNSSDGTPLAADNLD